MRESRRAGSLLLRTQSDARLLRMFKEGDEAAFEELVRRYRAPLVAYAARIAGASNADDVVQESLTAAYRSLSEHEIREFRAWLYTVVRNRSFNHIAARPRGVEPLREEIFATEDPVHAVEQRAALASLIEKVRALPVRQRRALVKHELEGLDYRRVASDLNLTIEAAKQLVYRARCRLRDAAGVLVPSGLLHSLAGEAASGPALLVKGGVAAGARPRAGRARRAGRGRARRLGVVLRGGGARRGRGPRGAGRGLLLDGDGRVDRRQQGARRAGRAVRRCGDGRRGAALERRERPGALAAGDERAAPLRDPRCLVRGQPERRARRRGELPPRRRDLLGGRSRRLVVAGAAARRAA